MFLNTSEQVNYFILKCSEPPELWVFEMHVFRPCFCYQHFLSITFHRTIVLMKFVLRSPSTPPPSRGALGFHHPYTHRSSSQDYLAAYNYVEKCHIFKFMFGFLPFIFTYLIQISVHASAGLVLQKNITAKIPQYSDFIFPLPLQPRRRSL